MSKTQTGTTYLAALRLALDQALEADRRVFVYGEDVAGPFGGAFKVTKGLSEKYPGRVINAPISEDAIAGIAVGAAIEGMRPVMEIQFADFATIALNQLVNHTGTIFWRAHRPCPLVMRLPCGGTNGAGPFHSQMPEAWLTHHPGLVVLAPATVQDAHDLLLQAVACLDPVVFLEHKGLYLHLRDQDFCEAPPAADQPLLTKAVVRRQGGHCTLASYSAMLHTCLAAAEDLAAEGIEVEVVDLRCLRPLDHRTVLESVQRTGRLVVATEAWPYGGIAAELVARVAADGFTYLDAPPRRVASRDTPIPFAPALWADHQPDRRRIAAAVRDTVGF